MEYNQNSEFTSVIDNLVTMFGHIVTKEVIATVVESCEGDLNLSMDAIMNLTNDGNIISIKDDEPPVKEDMTPTALPQQSGSSFSYAAQCGQNRGAIPKQVQVQRLPAPIFWTDQFREVISHHNKGTRVMILMRGLPGSGKSYLAASLVESMVGENYKNHIFSTDDYFMFRGQYMYDISKLSLAHSWNQERVRHASVKGISPIVVDNTNIEIWEMQPYLVDGVKNGYVIEVVEMNTPWAKKANQLFKRNKHGVPYHIIKRKLDNYTEGVTGEGLIRSFGLSYPSSMVPPIKRLLPPVCEQNISIQKPETTSAAHNTANETHIQLSQLCKVGNDKIPTTEGSTLSHPNEFKGEESTKTIEQPLLGMQRFNHPDTSSIKISKPISSIEEISQPVSCLQEISQPVPGCQEVSPSASSFQDTILPVSSFQEINQLNSNSQKKCQPGPSFQEISQLVFSSTGKSPSVTEGDIDVLTQEEKVKQKIVEAEKTLEEMAKFEEEWENGEKWDDKDQEAFSSNSLLKNRSRAVTNNNYHSSTVSPTTLSAENIVTQLPSYITSLESKPPRKSNNLSTDVESKDLMQTVNDCRDWRYIFVPPWTDPQEDSGTASKQEILTETISSSTCVEIGDTDLSGNYKVMSATPRDINEFYVAPDREKIPQKRMLDKSSMTNEGILISFNCPQKERHFVLFRQLFMHIERESLRDIFDNCCGDPNWAVENILGGGVKYTLKSKEGEDDSDLEEESDASSGLCTCLANYNIIPDIYKSDDQQVLPKVGKRQVNPARTLSYAEKKKRDAGYSDENIQLKRQIEQNIVISDNHYSEHCLKIRKIRRGVSNTDDNVSEQPSTSGISEAAAAYDTSDTTIPINEGSDDDDDSDDDSYISDNSSDKIINVNVGGAFIKQLDEMFDRKDMEYPDNIAFNISIPTSLLNELNALWMESIMYQLDEYTKKSAEMIKKDEEFARQIALKEEELLLEGKEPNVPDLKEIMDLEFAISIHQKEISEWRNKIPTDLAAKMTHDKLFNLFPDIEKELLLEMLIAHDNNFKATVEVVLMSMGRNDVLESNNGVNKFVMEKELERQEKLLEEQRKTLMQLEWPALSSGEEINMETVQGYRDEANQHLSFRNMSKQKAVEYVGRGMPQVATYYSDIANFHKIKEEQANSMAVASLIQYHAQNNTSCDTVDLHYFRVKEAKEAMDLFIDTQIHKLRESNKPDVVLFFITGRGLHSPGRPRVKPACAKRLRQRGLRYSECNPGLLRARVSIHDKLTFQVP